MADQPLIDGSLLGSFEDYEVLEADQAFSDTLNYESAIQLAPEDVDRLMQRVNYQLDQAEATKVLIRERIDWDRQVLDVDAQLAPYEGGPDATMPYIYSKVEGIKGHILEALNQNPWFTAKSKTVGAEDLADIYTRVMDREISAEDNKEQLAESVTEACDVGTGVVELGMVDRVSGESMLKLDNVKPEDFYIYPHRARSMSELSTFHCVTKPYYEVKAMIERGDYDRENGQFFLDAPHLYRDSTTYEEFRDNSYRHGDVVFNDNLPVELWKCFVRYEGSIYMIVFSREFDNTKPLLVLENPFGEAFNESPYERVRVAGSAEYFWGKSPSQILKGIQDMMDNAINARIAYNQFALTPVLVLDSLNPFADLIQENGIAPGVPIFTPGGMKNNPVQVLDIKSPDTTLEDFQLATRLGDMATFNEMFQGGNYAQGRRTKYEVETSYNSGTLKLRLNMTALTNDLVRIARKAHALVYTYKVRPAGVMEVYHDGVTNLIGAKEITENELQAVVSEAYQLGPNTNPQQVQQVYQEVFGSNMFYQNTVPSFARDDIEWQVTGTKLLADKVTDLNKLSMFERLIPMIGMAGQDSRVYNYLKRVCLAMDLPNYEELIGVDGGKRLTDDQYVMMMMQMAEATRQGGGGNNQQQPE